jgi:tetratricopeptide (TPR) repeat protein
MASVALLGRLASLGRDLGRLLGVPRPSDADPGQTDEWLRSAETAREQGRHEPAFDLYRQVVQRRGADPAALRGLRVSALALGRYAVAVDAQQRLLAAAAPGERAREAEVLASVHHEWGCAELARDRTHAALAHFRSALRAARDFTPATVALGDALMGMGETREAVRTWERAIEVRPSLPILARLERARRDEGRPTRMIALYREALARTPDDPSLAVSLGRVYLELEMLDEAADQLEKVEAGAPDLPIVHAYLAVVFERRGDWRGACEEYRRALSLGNAGEWPHRCARCGARAPRWLDRCAVCREWNSLRPA